MKFICFFYEFEILKLNFPGNIELLKLDLSDLKEVKSFSKSLKKTHQKFDTVIVDCINLLASNALLKLPQNSTQQESDEAILFQIEDLLNQYKNSSATWLIVTNEVGLGLVPPYKLGRLFRDSLGRANQKLAKISDEMIFMVSGIPLYIKK